MIPGWECVCCGVLREPVSLSCNFEQSILDLHSRKHRVGSRLAEPRTRLQEVPCSCRMSWEEDAEDVEGNRFSSPLWTRKSLSHH